MKHFRKLLPALYAGILLFSVGPAMAQSLPYARHVVDTLSAPGMHGRGYVNQGDLTAARYLAAEFKRLGLQAYTDQYFQPFQTPINALPGKLKLIVNKKELVPGQDYLVDPGCPSFSGQYRTVWLEAKELLTQASWVPKVQRATDAWVVIAPYTKADFDKDQLQQINEVISFLKYHPDNPARGTIILTNDKLTWGTSTEQYSKPAITLRAEAVTSSVKTVSLEVESKFYPAYATQNVVGFIPGTAASDSLLVMTAHYDHLGMMGREAVFPGANDNASGVAFLLSLARYYAAHRPKHTMVFMAFAGEEAGLLGSRYFVEHPLFPLQNIRFLMNFDMAGTGDDGIQVVNGKIYKTRFDTLNAINERRSLLKQVKIRGEACNSDHCFFYRQGVPSFFIYTLGGIQAYHDIYDRAETLPLMEFEDYFQLITAFTTYLDE